MITGAEKSPEELIELRAHFGSYADFEREVSKLSVLDILVPQNGGDRLPRGHERFSFAPIHVSLSDGKIAIQKPDGLELPEDYFQEADNAIALVYRVPEIGVRSVCAVMSAGLDLRGRPLIVEIQGYNPGKRGPLYAGIDWRRSLLEAWKAVLPGLGFDELGIRSSWNNQWSLSVGKRERLRDGATEEELSQERQADIIAYLDKIKTIGATVLYPTYDGFAQAMGFHQDTLAGGAKPNWYISLSQEAAPDLTYS